MKHRIVFMGVWLVFALALFIFPGFEVRGLAIGMIIGAWPCLLCKIIWESQHSCPVMFLGMMILLSGVTVGLLSWILDKARMPRAIWIVLGVSMLAAAIYFNVGGLTYQQWQGIPSVASAMEVSETNFLGTRWDFSKQIVIPRTLAGGLWGLYGILGLCVVWSAAIMLIKSHRR